MQQQEYLDTLDKKALRLKVLIEDLFEVSKATSGNVLMHPEAMDLTALLKQVQFEMGDQLDASPIDFRWQLPAEKVPVVLDGQRTCRIDVYKIQHRRYMPTAASATLPHSSLPGRLPANRRHNGTKITYNAVMKPALPALVY